jgi:hypothetical protein
MINWLIENKELISGIVVPILVGIIGLYLKHRRSKKKMHSTKRTINIKGEKSFYVEKNEGEININ